MKILVNTSTLVVGGGIQVGLNFIKHTLQTSEHDYFYLLSKQVFDQLNYEVPKSKYVVMEISPAKVIKGFRSRRKIKLIEKNYDPDIVYSVGAPSYVKFLNPEVLRITNPYLIGASKLALSKYPISNRLRIMLILRIQKLYVKNSHFIITQTESAKNDIVKNLDIPKHKVYVISNIQSSIFKVNDSLKKIKSDPIKILAFAAPYPHKNLSIIPEVANHLIKMGIDNFEFIVTIPLNYKNRETNKFHSLCKSLQVSDKIDNLGKINFKDVPELYQKSDILFLPTLLETFSVTYLEAMASGIPIVTTDLLFAKDVCADAALYFKPEDSLDAANKLKSIIKNNIVRKELLTAAKARIKVYPNENVIYEEHIKVLEDIYTSNNHV